MLASKYRFTLVLWAVLQCLQVTSFFPCIRTNSLSARVFPTIIERWQRYKKDGDYDYDYDYDEQENLSLFEEDNQEEIIDWVWEPYNDMAQVYLPPPSSYSPKTILHFIGGTVFGSYPRAFYAPGFLQRIAQETHSVLVITAIPISFQSNPLNHIHLARRMAKAFRKVYQNILYDEYGTDLKNMSIVGIGHSLGSRLHVIINTEEPLLRLAKKRHANILLSFNNFPSMASIPGISTLSQGIEETRNEVMKLDDSSYDYDDNEEEEEEDWRDWDSIKDNDDDEEEDEEISIRDLLSAMKQRIQSQLSSIKAHLTPSSLLQDTSQLEFQPSPEELWQRIQNGSYVHNVPKTLIIQFDDDNLDQSARLAKSLYQSRNYTTTNNDTSWDLKFARLHGTHVTPIVVGTSHAFRSILKRVISLSWVDRVLEESLQDYRNLLRQNQRTKERRQLEQKDLVESIKRYIVDVVIKEPVLDTEVP